MKRRLPSIGKQRGVMMLEALIAILIFSLGILGLVGMQSAAVSHTSQAKYRTDASFLANKVIGEMWGDTDLSGYKTGGAKFKTWLSDEVATSLPTAGATVDVAADNTVTVTITWTLPNEATAHRYVATARIQRNT